MSSQSSPSKKKMTRMNPPKRRVIVDSPHNSKSKPITLTVNTCAICLDDVTVDREVKLDSCDHKYCGQCITTWVETSENRCPLCKKKITKITSKDVLGRNVDYIVKEKEQQQPDEPVEGVFCETCGHELTEVNFDHNVCPR